MKDRLLLIILNLGFIFHLTSQCPSFEVELTTQEAVDNFKINYPGCTEITEQIYIEGDGITSLEGLLGISSVSGLTIVRTPNLHSLAGLDSLSSAFFLTIENTGITNLEGLNALDSVEFFFRISINPQLTDLTGLGALRYANALSIYYNFALTSLEGLTSLVTVENLGVDFNPLLIDLRGMPLLEEVNSLYVGYNDALQRLTGIEDITAFKHDIIIIDNPSLISLNALEQVESCEDLEISGNNWLASLSGLGSLTKIRGNFTVKGNEGLVSLEELDALDSIGGNMEISENPNLQALSSFHSLRYIGGRLSFINNEELISLGGIDQEISIGEVVLIFNDFLSICSVQSICDHLISGGPATIGGNNDGCSTTGQVLAGCTVSTEDNSAGQISVYPNPTNGITYLDGLDSSTLQVDVYNSHGKLCSNTGIDNRQIDLSHLPVGLYYVRIQTGSVTLVKVIVKV